MEPLADNLPGNWHPSDTALMRTMAALLIANSHLENFYPSHPWLAGDGLLGNGFFYFLSGFGIALGARARLGGFFCWYGRRISRIYPAVILGVLIFYLGVNQCWRTYQLADYFSLFIFPTGYPFVGHIMTLYAVLYWLLRAPSRLPHRLMLGGTVAAYLFCYFAYLPSVPRDQPLFLGNPASWRVHYLFNSALVLFGALLATATARPRQTFLRDLFLLFSAFTLYVVFKFEMVKGHFPRWFMLLHVLATAICLLALRTSAADEIASLCKRIRPLGWFIALLAGLTLEMYIVQTHTHEFHWLIRLSSPLNLAGFWILTITGAAVLAKAVAMIRSFMPAPAKAPKPEPAAS